MLTKQQRRDANKRYITKNKERGVIISSFLLPAVLFAEVKQFIKIRSEELKKGKV